MSLQIALSHTLYRAWQAGCHLNSGMLLVAPTKNEVHQRMKEHALRHTRGYGSRSPQPNGHWQPLHPMFAERIATSGDYTYFSRSWGITKDDDGVMGAISEHPIYYSSAYSWSTMIAKTGDVYLPRDGVMPNSRYQFLTVDSTGSRFDRLPVGAVDWEATQMHSSFIGMDRHLTSLAEVGDLAEYTAEYELFISQLYSNWWVGSYDVSR